MTNKADRYIMVYSDTYGVDNEKGTEIWLDKETGISYLFSYAGYEESFTPLLDEKGRTILKHLIKDNIVNFPWESRRAS